jgi:hypothetical protein
MTLIVAIIVKSGIVVDFADFAIFDPISDDGEWYSPGMCSRRDCLAFFANRRSPLVCRAVSFRHVLRAGVAVCVPVAAGVLIGRGGLPGTQRWQRPAVGPAL